jgi:selenide,water dikinase
MGTKRTPKKQASTRTDWPRLTAEVSGGGCAAKLGPAELGGIIASLPRRRDPRVLVANETSDDAGVYRVRADLAIVNTVDFFPPIVDDPYQFGRIAAANALSDIYAMGARPITALNIVGFPSKRLAPALLGEIMRGGDERVRAAGAAVVGGHTIEDGELKYGMAVTGVIHPDRIVRNGGARKGDVIVLTKPLGTGIVATGIKQGATDPVEEAAAIESMTALNDIAGAALGRYRARACTDVTGFGLGGHAAEMIAASGAVRMELDGDAIGLLPGTARLVEAGFSTGGCKRIRAFLERKLHCAAGLAPAVVEAVVDPQTSGGLLVSLPGREAPGYVEALRRRGLRPAVVGRIVARPPRSAVLVAVE